MQLHIAAQTGSLFNCSPALVERVLIMSLLWFYVACFNVSFGDNIKDKEALYKVAFETDNISFVELLLRHNK